MKFVWYICFVVCQAFKNIKGFISIMIIKHEFEKKKFGDFNYKHIKLNECNRLDFVN